MRHFAGVFLILFCLNKTYGQKDTTIFNENDSSYLKGRVVNNKRTGSWFKFNKDNIITETITYKKDNKATVRTFKSKEQLSEKYDCEVLKDYSLVLNGQYESYDDRGHVQRKGVFVNNLGDGLWVIYNEKGDTINCMHYKQGKLVGNWKEYYEGKKIKIEGQYENDLRVGKWREYYLNGKIKSEGEYYPSKQSILYSPKVIDSLKKSGVDTKIISFPLEVFDKNQDWLYKDEQGKSIRKEIWDKGKLIKTIPLKE